MSQAGVKRVGFLEGLRGFLAVFVMFAHTGFWVGLDVVTQTDTVHPGRIAKIITFLDPLAVDAVNLFMILSGFVIFYLLDHGRETYGAYVTRRFLRLWPVFMLCIVLGLLMNGLYIDVLQNNPWTHNTWIQHQLEIAQVIERNKLPYLLVDLPMLHGVVPAVILQYAGSAFSSLSWCISTEWQYYLIAPLLFLLLRNLRGLVAVAAAMLLLSWKSRNPFLYFANPNWAILPLQLHWFYIGLLSYLAYRYARRHQLTFTQLARHAIRTGTPVFWVAFVLVLATYALVLRRQGAAGWAWLLVIVPLIDSAAERATLPARIIHAVFDNPVSRYFGRISYPVYLVHWPVSIALVWLLMKTLPSLSWASAYVVLMVAVPAVTWPVSHIVHLYLEQPAMSLGRTLASRWFARPSLPSSDAVQRVAV